MTESKICTCPSGDGSLRWPCPKHPAVEQAGGDERAAFNRWIAEQQLCQGSDISLFKLERNGALVSLHELLRDAYQAGQDRVALAQPSPAQARSTWPKLEKPAQVGAIRFYAGLSSRLVVEAAQRLYEYKSAPKQEAERIERFQASRKQLFESLGPAFSDVLHECLAQGEQALAVPAQAEQAEAERPEVVGYRIMRAHADKIYQRVDKAAAEYEAGRSALGYMEDIAEAALCLRNRLDDLLAAPVAQAGQVPAAWYYDAPSQAEAAIIDIRGMWGEDDCPTYEDVASALRRLLAAEPGTEVPQAWLDVQAERRRQITAEGWTPYHDDLYCAAELPRAAAAYILSGANDEAPAIWPFVAKWWKPRDARANYVRAGALILAEIERLDRAAAPGKEGV
ncbi:hypothetical protein ACG3QR_19560 [Pseudomonas aeruginosa]